jgi:DNA-binding NtrC family response regulator
VSEPRKVLVTLTDVEPAIRLNAQLEAAGIATAVASPLDDIRGMIRRESPDVVVLTGGVLDSFNVGLVRELLWDDIAVVGLADLLDPDTAARCRALGYAEVVPKPVEPAELASVVKRLLDRQRLARLTGMAGESAPIREVLVKVEQFAPVASTVLIEGESGTGKELVARAIHRLSPRRNKPFIAVNVGALAESLLESELFGHEKGAFTGAAERRLGRFELADGGTLFLDEIGEIPPSTQVKLLRVLEERELTRVGGTQAIPVDVRVVAATNQPLRELVERGVFRGDLYYRLNVLSMYLPPLRERRDDIPLLVRRFIRDVARQHDKQFQGISADALQLLVEYGWPGNIRELRNLIESMVVLAPGREISADDIPAEIRLGGAARRMPVPIGPVVRGTNEASGRELEFIVRSLVELKLQVEDLRRRLDDDHRVLSTLTNAPVPGQWLGEVRSPGVGLSAGVPFVGGIEAMGAAPAPAVVTITPGMTMAQIERAAIEAALKETRGNRRKAAELLAIGERTMYRKLKEYELDTGYPESDE